MCLCAVNDSSASKPFLSSSVWVYCCVRFTQLSRTPTVNFSSVGGSSVESDSSSFLSVTLNWTEYDSSQFETQSLFTVVQIERNIWQCLCVCFLTNIVFLSHVLEWPHRFAPSLQARWKKKIKLQRNDRVRIDSIISNSWFENRALSVLCRSLCCPFLYPGNHGGFDPASRLPA